MFGQPDFAEAAGADLAVEEPAVAARDFEADGGPPGAADIGGRCRMRGG